MSKFFKFKAAAADISGVTLCLSDFSIGQLIVS